MKKKKCTLDTIIKAHPNLNYQQLYHFISKEIEAGRLEPIRASKRNGKKPSLFNGYWEIREEEDYQEILEELTYQISPLLDMTYYKKNPKRYAEDAKEIRLLSEYLIRNKQALEISETINERSFEIFHREKFLDREKGQSLLERLHVEKDRLNYYETSVPMSYYSHHKETPQKFLIIENKDTFYSMRKYLIEGNQKILGLKFGTLIYGGGKGIYRSFWDFVCQMEPYFGDSQNQVYYFGDLDLEGIQIYLNLSKMYQTKVRIFLFTKAYQRMLKKAEKIGMEQLPKTKDGQKDLMELLPFLEEFSEEERRQIELLLEQRYYIPQEILNVGDYFTE